MRQVLLNATEREVELARVGPVAWDVAVHGAMAGTRWENLEARLLMARLVPHADEVATRALRSARGLAARRKSVPGDSSSTPAGGAPAAQATPTRAPATWADPVQLGRSISSRAGRHARALAHVDPIRVKREVDVVYSHLRGVLTWPSRPPVVWSTNGVIPEIWNWRQGAEAERVRNLHTSLQRDLARRADLVVCWSDYGADNLLQAGVDSGKVVVLPPILDLVDPEGEPPATLRSRAGVEAARKGGASLVAVHVGSWGWLKGLPEVLQAVETVEGMVLHVVGCEATGVFSPRVVWHPSMPPGRVAALLAGADVLVMPARYETLGVTFIEAMRAGVGIVGSTIGTVKEITGGAALLVDPGDAGTLGEVLRGLAADRGELGRLRAAARRRYEDCFAPEALRPRWEAVLG